MNDADDYIYNDVAGQQQEETKKRRVPQRLENNMSSRLSMTGEIDESREIDEQWINSNGYSNSPGVSQPGSQPGADAVNGREPSLDDPGGPIQLETIIAEQRPKEDGDGFDVAGTDAIVYETGHGRKLISCMMVLALAAFGGGVVTGIAVGKDSQDSIVERMTNLNHTEQPSSNPTFTSTDQPSEAPSTSFPPTSLPTQAPSLRPSKSEAPSTSFPPTSLPTQAPSLRPSETPSTPDPTETPTLE